MELRSSKIPNNAVCQYLSMTSERQLLKTNDLDRDLDTSILGSTSEFTVQPISLEYSIQLPKVSLFKFLKR